MDGFGDNLVDCLLRGLLQSECGMAKRRGEELLLVLCVKEVGAERCDAVHSVKGGDVADAADDHFISLWYCGFSLATQPEMRCRLCCFGSASHRALLVVSSDRS